jgi:5-methylcytosine-specific restriction endonuclease McrA
MLRQRIQINKGDRYRHWTVIKEIELPIGKKRKFVCRCNNCNLESDVSINNLLHDKSTQCRKCINNSNIEIEIGKRYKNWLVVSYDTDVFYDKSNRLIKKYNCKCLICNEIYSVNGQSLKSTKTSFNCKSCAFRKDYSKHVGEKYNKLTILSICQREAYKDVYCIAKCDCGNTKKIMLKSITSGKTTSCGCYRSKATAQRQKEKANPNKQRTKRELRKHLSISVNPKIKKRDNCSCQNCGKTKGQLDVHHIFDLEHYPKLGKCEHNLITLCIKCHARDFHKTYSKFGENTLQDLESWLKREYKYRKELLEEYNKYY